MFGQFDPRAHHCGLFRGDRWHVQGVGNRTGQQIIGHLFGHLQGDIFLGLGRGRTQMRGHNNIGQIKQRVFNGRFGFEHIKRGTRHMARFQQIGQGSFINQTTARAVDNPHARFGFGQVFGT